MCKTGADISTLLHIGRQRDDKFASFRGSVFRCNLTAMKLDDFFHDGQTQPGTAGLSGPRFIDPVKALKYIIPFFFRNAAAFIRYRNLDLVLQF